MIVKNFFIISLSIFSILFSDINYKKNELLLALDPFDLSNFILNKYYPNQNLDLNYYSIMLDGSTNFPLYQSIPYDHSFNRDVEGTISELRYKERKADKYFDTSISLKKDINQETDFLLQLETKSIVDNINQNVFFDYRKLNDNLILGISYLYHYEDDPDVYNLVYVDGKNSSKENESFNSGLNITYFNEKFTYTTHFAFQTSHIDRPSSLYAVDDGRLRYNHQTIWYNNIVDYNIFKSLKIYFSNQYKKILLETDDNSGLILNEHYNQLSSGFSYYIQDNFKLRIGFDHYNTFNKPHISLSYQKERISIQINNDNFIIDETQHNNGIYENSRLDFTTRYNSKVSLDYGALINNIEIGKIINNNYKYNYVISEGEASIWKVIFDYDYYKYFNVERGDLSINSYLNYGITYLPFKDKFKFEMFGKINYYQYEFNSTVDLLSLDLFNNFNSTLNNVKLYNLSIGFIFDSFSISYKFKNGLTSQTLNNDIIFADDMYYNHFNCIEIDWIFKE